MGLPATILGPNIKGTPAGETFTSASSMYHVFFQFTTGSGHKSNQREIPAQAEANH